jgi:hypothetical protein
MTELIKLYRADTKGNNTLPEKYSTDGLLTKQKDGGDPLFLKNYGWLKSIKSHIHKNDLVEKFLYDTTSFLSFTDNLEIALNKYLPTKEKYGIEKVTSKLEADGFLFTFSFDKQLLKKIGDGVFLIDFQCNYEKFKNPNSLIDTFTKCNICATGVNYQHNLLLINAPIYLDTLVSLKPELKTAFELSSNDNEWLLMPLDPMKDGIGFQSRIPVADFWTVEYYKHIKN